MDVRLVARARQVVGPDSMAGIWWDSSPSRYVPVRKNLLGSYPSAAGYIHQLLPDYFMAPHVGFSGATTNPRLIAQAMLEENARWEHWLRRQNRGAEGAGTVLTWLYQQAIREGARQLMPLWILSQRRYGWMSAQIDFRVGHANAWVTQGIKLSRLSPNLMIKVPASRQGLDVVQQLVAKGCGVNVTLCFTVAQAAAALRAIRAGQEQGRERTGREEPPHVITFMIGRFGAEPEFTGQASRAGIALGVEERRWADLEIYRSIQALLREDRRQHGDAPVRLLLSSIKTDPGPFGIEHCWHLERTDPVQTLYTLTPEVVEFMVRRHLSGQPLVFGGSDSCMPDAVRASLMAIPYFERGNRIDGLLPEHFEHHPAFVTASQDAAAAWQRLEHFVGSARSGPLERAS